jgi:Fe2+ or Zn2+ uptake regulation protein
MKTRRTRQLTLIDAVLHEAGDHPTAAQIHARVSARLPGVSLGTVYRNLEKLVQSGRAIVVRLDGEVTRYDGTVAAHDHFQCRACGRITDLMEELGPALDTGRLHGAGYAVDTHRLAVFGTCPDCR